MTLLIQDGRRGGHLKWATDAISAGAADGVVISPFHTPRVAAPRHQSGATVSQRVLDVSGEVIFDAMTHASMLPSTNDLVHYDTWELWGPAGRGLDSDVRRIQHVERVFARQVELSTPRLTPTLALDSPNSVQAVHALRTTQLGRGLARDSGVSIAGRRSFWRAGPDLDAFIGQVASLRAPLCVLTVVNDVVFDNVPELSDADAFAGLCRSVDSLGLRSRVIVLYSDYSGLPAVAAGADTIGTGWDRGMRTLDPLSFQLTSASAGPRIPASYVTQGGLLSVLRRDAGDAITRLGNAVADPMRGAPTMPRDDAAERVHHLHQLREVVTAVTAAGADRASRVAILRAAYEQADAGFNHLATSLPRGTVAPTSRQRWVTQPYEALKQYARAEGIWA